MPKARHLSVTERNAYRSLEDIIGCKWSAAVIGALSRGINRPGQLERYIPGISTKILNERLKRLADYHVIERHDCTTGAVMHVEYRLTDTGQRLAAIIEQLHALQSEHTTSIAAPVTKRTLARTRSPA